MPTYAQSDLFDGLFEKEEPQFFARVTPTEVPGEARLIFHFTHSKLRELKVSVWVKDLGTSFQGSGKKQLMEELHTVGNRQRDTVMLTGLAGQHFYNIGVDYQQQSGLSRKFASKVIREHYRYPGPRQAARQQEEPRMQAKSPAATPRTAPAPARASEPCEDPALDIRVDPNGYCGSLNRPAVIIKCHNCQGATWDFSVEVRQTGGKWQSTRADGRPQAALGVAPRTEPLCTLEPGEYQLRVLAWGEHCSMPVISTLGTTISVGNPQNFAKAPSSVIPAPDPYRDRPAEPVQLPDACGVAGTAALIGNTIRGGLRLPPASDCASYNPYVELVYVHPAYRDIDMGQIQLYGGMEMPFELDLDEQDMQRGIHTLRATVYLQHPDLTRPAAVETFWIRAEQASTADTRRNPVIPDLENRLDTTPADRAAANEPMPEGYESASSPQMQGTISRRGIERQEDGLYIDEDLLEQEGSTINVTASDPNCNQIQDLQLVYSPTQPDRPLYLSWLSPRCCQESGCAYTLWSGPRPDKLSLLVKGQKPGAKVSELLQNLPANHRYFEVAVQTSNGVRKAAYVPGEGPIYGIDAVLDYHDQFKPQQSDPIKGVNQGDVRKKGGATVGGALSGRMGGQAVSRPVAMNGAAQQPKFPISKFEPCKYSRATTLSTDQPLQEGEQVTIKYDFDEPGHQYTLYHQPPGSNRWVVAPGTQDLQPEPAFEIEARNYHNGKYLILVYKASKNWGCLSAPLDEPLKINVMR
jgi:hypothetical protein